MNDRRISRFQRAVWGPTSTRVRQSAWLRRPAIAGYRAFARVALAGAPPKVLANSIPKSGTHLLTQLLSGVPDLAFTGVHLVDREFCADRDERGDGLGAVDLTAFAKQIARIRDGQYLTGHIGALPGIPEALRDHGFHTLFIIRDPRDVVVSLAFYLTKNDRVHAHQRFAKLRDTDERITAAITGLPAGGDKPAVLSIGTRLQRYRGWLDDPKTCVIRFEDLVGSAGGGSDAAQHDTIRRVLAHCCRPASDELVDKLARSTFATHSATFRRGAIGDWRNHLNGEHLAALNELAPGLLEAYGYA